MKKVVYLGILLSCMAVSCSQQELSNDSQSIDGQIPSATLELSGSEYLSICFAGNNELSESEALSILEEFTSEKGVNNRSSDKQLFKLKKKTVVNSKTMASRSTDVKEDHITFYEFSIGDNQSASGFAVVCGDKRFPNVLAFSDEGGSEEVEPAQVMIKLAQNSAIKHISRIRHIEDSLRSTTLHKISKEMSIPVEDIDVRSLEPKIYITDEPEVESRGQQVSPGGNLMAQIGPLTSTKWNQDSPYNHFADFTPQNLSEYFGDSYKGHYPAGCVVIAIAQACAYLKPNTGLPNFNWTDASTVSFSKNDTLSSASLMVSRMVDAIAEGSGTSYSEKGGSTSTENARNFIKNWGLYMDNSTDCTFQNIKSTLDALRLVYVTSDSRTVISSRSYVSSGRHAWLIDGYQIRQRTLTRQILKQNNVYCHCNFGWGGNSTGWYLFETSGNILFESDDVLQMDEDFNFYYEHYVYDNDFKCYPNFRKG